MPRRMGMETGMYSRIDDVDKPNTQDDEQLGGRIERGKQGLSDQQKKTRFKAEDVVDPDLNPEDKLLSREERGEFDLVSYRPKISKEEKPIEKLRVPSKLKVVDVSESRYSENIYKKQEKNSVVEEVILPEKNFDRETRVEEIGFTDEEDREDLRPKQFGIGKNRDINWKKMLPNNYTKGDEKNSKDDKYKGRREKPEINPDAIV